MFLIAGGPDDPNLRRLAACARTRGVETLELWVGPGRAPRLSWDVVEDRLIVEGRHVRPSAGFVRYDVFSELDDPRPVVARRAHAWYTTIQGWLMAHTDVAMPNRVAGVRVTNKPQMLALAREVGFSVPFTLVSNEVDRIASVAGALGLVVKPVDGGGFCETADAAIAAAEERGGVAAAPAIVQPRLVAPEYRVYRIGSRCFGFRMDSSELDYRRTGACEVVPVKLDVLPPSLPTQLFTLCDGVGLDFAAADFKTCADTGDLMFLEVNSSPMFAVFDAKVDGALCDALHDWFSGVMQKCNLSRRIQGSRSRY